MDVRKMLLEIAKYGGDTEPGRKALSASELTNPLLQIWLRHKHGVIEGQEVNMATLGSIMHYGIEKHIISLGTNLQPEYKVEKEMPNSWKLTGTIDLYDPEEKVIYDWKFVKKYRVKKLKEAIEKGEDDDYITQINAYRMCLGEPVKMKIVCISPDAGMVKGRMVPFVEEIEVPELDEKRIEQLFLEKTNALQDHLDADLVPEKCDDLWIRKVDGKVIPMRCHLYCSYKNVCPHFNPKDESVLAAWGF